MHVPLGFTPFLSSHTDKDKMSYRYSVCLTDSNCTLHLSANTNSRSQFSFYSGVRNLPAPQPALSSAPVLRDKILMASGVCMNVYICAWKKASKWVNCGKWDHLVHLIQQFPVQSQKQKLSLSSCQLLKPGVVPTGVWQVPPVSVLSPGSRFRADKQCHWLG